MDRVPGLIDKIVKWGHWQRAATAIIIISWVESTSEPQTNTLRSLSIDTICRRDKELPIHWMAPLCWRQKNCTCWGNQYKVSIQGN